MARLRDQHHNRLDWKSHWMLCMKNRKLHCFLNSFKQAIAYFLAYLPDLFRETYFITEVRAIAETKCHREWGHVFLLAIGCNWMVCLGVWLCYSGKTITCKIIGMWWPVFAFVMCMFFHYF